MSRPRKYSDEQIIAALKAMKGLVYLAADALGCDATTIYDRVKSSPAVKEALHHEDGRLTDIAELRLHNYVLQGDLGAIKYRLSNKGRDRGYGEKLEISGKLDGDMKLGDDLQDKIANVIAEAMANKLGGEDGPESEDAGETEAGTMGGGDGGGAREGEGEEGNAG